MLSVNQMFYGIDDSEPVWLVDGVNPSPVKYHYLAAAHAASPTQQRAAADPYYNSARDPYPDHHTARPRHVQGAPVGQVQQASRHGPVSAAQVAHANGPRHGPIAHAQAPPPGAGARVHGNLHSSPNPHTTSPQAMSADPRISTSTTAVPHSTAISHTPVVPVVPAGRVHKSPYTLLLKVPICCEACEERVVRKLLDVDGVMSVKCDAEHHKVTITGVADTDEVMRVAKKAFKRATLWS